MFHPEVWADFLARPRCLGATGDDYPAWHKGRPRYFIWAIDVDMASVNGLLGCFRELLGGRLMTPYLRRPHVTVAVSGFLGETPVHDDDITPELLERQVRRLQALRLRPFTLAVGGANSFASAPFLEVGDPDGVLELMREALVNDSDEFRTTPYVPHVTIGIYSGEHDAQQIVRLLRADNVGGAGKPEPITITVEGVGIYSYDATNIGSPLRLERTVTFSAAGAAEEATPG